MREGLRDRSGEGREGLRDAGQAGPWRQRSSCEAAPSASEGLNGKCGRTKGGRASRDLPGRGAGHVPWTASWACVAAPPASTWVTGPGRGGTFLRLSHPCQSFKGLGMGSDRQTRDSSQLGCSYYLKALRRINGHPKAQHCGLRETIRAPYQGRLHHRRITLVTKAEEQKRTHAGLSPL